MYKQMCKSKIHRLTVTETNVDYEGSITLDPDLIEAAELLPYEKVQIANVTNGSRLETYIISGERGSGEVCLNGAAANLCSLNDVVLVISYASYDAKELETYSPVIVHVNSANKITNVNREKFYNKIKSADFS